jgi:tetratricopeptide (TPR) repeat protein
MGITQHSFLGNPEQALKHLEKVDQISERRGEPWRFGNFHLAYAQVLGDLDRCQEAEEHYRQGLELIHEVPAHKAFFYFWAVCAVSRGDSVLASQLIEEYRLTKARIGETDSYEFYRCRIYYLAKDYKRAESEFRLFLSANPDHARGTLYLARTLIEGELDPVEGLDLINALLESSPEDLDLLYSRAYALHKLGRHQEALELLEMNHANSFASYRTREKYLQEVREAISADL